MLAGKGKVFMTQEVTITLEITLQPEAVEVFSQVCGEGLKATKEFPGCREVRIVQHKDEPNRFLFVERWDSEEAYQNYVTWRTERGEIQGMQAMATKIETSIWPTVVATT